MNAPPFPVPAGMTWDSEKKRFFKKIPQEAKIRPKQKSQRKGSLEHGGAELCQNLDGKSTLDNSESSLHSRVSSHRLLNSMPSFLNRPTHADSQAHKKALVKACFVSLKHVSTTSIIPWNLNAHVTHSSQCDERWKHLKVTSLHKVPGFSTLLCFQNGAGNCYLMDVTEIDAFQPSNALIFQDWTFGNLPRRRSKMKRHQELIDLCYHRTDSQIRTGDDTSHGVFDIELEFAVMWFGNSLIMANTVWMEYALEYEKHYPRRRLSSLGVGYEIVMACKKPFIQQVRVRSWPISNTLSKVLILYVARRQVGLIEVQWTHHSDADKSKNSVKRAGYCNVNSDIICFDIVTNGSSFMIGLRNGDILQYRADDFLCTLKESVEIDQPRPRFIVDDQIRPTNATVFKKTTYPKGAVTHVKAISDQEVIMAFSDGVLELRSLQDWSTPMISYIGHVNSWSLTLPMTIDVSNRLLAMAGQDQKVRLWHLDDPFPLENKMGTKVQDECSIDIANATLSTLPLQQITFTKPITALTFCPRRDVVKEAAESEDFSDRGNLPRLAIATNGAEIAFFE